MHPEAEVDPIRHDERYDVLGDAILELRGENFHEDVAMLLFEAPKAAGIGDFMVTDMPILQLNAPGPRRLRARAGAFVLDG